MKKLAFRSILVTLWATTVFAAGLGAQEDEEREAQFFSLPNARDARELAPHGIRVNSVNPGLTNTRRLDALRADPDVWARCLAAVPLAREAQPREVAAAILWLLSDAAAYVTGETINVDGGISME